MFQDTTNHKTLEKQKKTISNTHLICSLIAASHSSVKRCRAIETLEPTGATKASFFTSSNGWNTKPLIGMLLPLSVLTEPEPEAETETETPTLFLGEIFIIVVKWAEEDIKVEDDKDLEFEIKGLPRFAPSMAQNDAEENIVTDKCIYEWAIKICEEELWAVKNKKRVCRNLYQ